MSQPNNAATSQCLNETNLYKYYIFYMLNKWGALRTSKNKSINKAPLWLILLGPHECIENLIIEQWQHEFDHPKSTYK
jgi:hypothetical protein